MPANQHLSDEEIRDHFRNGVWDDPAWFLSPSRLLDDAGFPLDLRLRAAAELRWLYPAEVCRELLTKGNGPSLSPLFWLNGWSVCPLLAVGLDISVVGRFSDTRLIADLRNRREFESAATELSVWANLRRQGFDVDRVPTAAGKTPDFRVFAEHRLHRLEVKKFRESDYERLRAETSMKLQMELIRATAFPGRMSVLRPTAKWEELVRGGNQTALKQAVPELLREVRIAADRAVAAGGAVGRYEGGSLLVLEIEAAADFPNGSASEELLPPETPERRADRALRLVREACDQLRAGVGIVVVDVGEAVDAMRVRETLVAKEQGHPVRFSSCETVIVRGVGFNRFGEPTRYAHPISLRGPLLPVHQLIADAISFRHFRNPSMGRRGTRLVV
jgi:hypothetical protein